MRGNNILLLSGNTGTGKSTVLARICQELEQSGISAGGILAPGRYLDSGLKDYDLQLLPGRKKLPLSTQTENQHWISIGGFYFNPEAIYAGLSHLASLTVKRYHLCLLDEIGPFELKGLLWAPVIPDLLALGVPMIWTVRERIIERVKSKWDIPGAGIISVDERAVEKIRDWIGKNIPDLSPPQV